MLCKLRKDMINLINLSLSELEKRKEQYLENVGNVNAQPEILSTSLVDDKTPSIENDTVNSDDEQSVHSADQKRIESAENKPNHSNQNNEEQYLFSPKTISSVLCVDLPPDIFFRFDLQNQSTFQLPSDVWQSMYENKKVHCLKKNLGKISF